MESSDKIIKYEEFLNEVLKVDLQKELERRDKIYESIAAHSQLKQIINLIIETNPQEGLRTQVDLGSNFYSQAHIPDPSKIYINIGLGVHLEMNLKQAEDYCEKKINILHQEVENSTKMSAKIKAKIRFVELALREVSGLNLTNEKEERRHLFAL